MCADCGILSYRKILCKQLCVCLAVLYWSHFVIDVVQLHWGADDLWKLLRWLMEWKYIKNFIFFSATGKKGLKENGFLNLVTPSPQKSSNYNASNCSWQMRVPLPGSYQKFPFPTPHASAQLSLSWKLILPLVQFNVFLHISLTSFFSHTLLSHRSNAEPSHFQHFTLSQFRYWPVNPAYLTPILFSNSLQYSTNFSILHHNRLSFYMFYSSRFCVPFSIIIHLVANATSHYRPTLRKHSSQISCIILHTSSAL